MKNRDAVKLGHEKAVADQLLATLQIAATFERQGDPSKNEPDVIYKLDGRTVGIEVATAYYENTDAKDAWEIAAGEKPLQAGEIRPRSGGVVGSPDETICNRIQEELDDKCGKAYAGTDETWLCINQDAALSDAKSVAECVKNLEIPPGRKFARIYLTYTAAVHEGGRYTSMQIG
jgi:hypothetical protein